MEVTQNPVTWETVALGSVAGGKPELHSEILSSLRPRRGKDSFYFFVFGRKSTLGWQF